MKDEEMAEEYRKDLKSKFFLSEPQLDLACQGFKDGFLTGLRAGRPQWHDLRKDPTDIPPRKNDVYSIEVWAKDASGNYGRAVFSYACLEDDGEYNHWVGVIPTLWTEIPTFDKE